MNSHFRNRVAFPKLPMNKLIVIFLFAFTGAFAQADLKKLDAYYAKALKDWNVPGMSIAIVKDGKVIFSKGYGTKEVGKSEAPDGNTLYAIASNTKAFTATAMGILVDEGKLSWNDKVTQYIPWFELPDPMATREATIRDILSHRVGLGTFSGDLIWYRSNLSDEEIIRRIKHLPVGYSFRAGYGYSNLMYITAGEIIERVSEKSWADFVKAKLFQPLAMNRTIVGTRELEQMGNYATPHIYGTDKNVAMPWEDWATVAATGGILSSVNDMAQWMIFQMNHGVWKNDTIIDPKTHNLIWTPHNNFVVDHTNKNLTGHLAGYGLGWSVGDYRGKFRVGHTGGYSGMLSAVALIPEENLGVVVLTNGMRPVYSSLVNYTLDAFLKAPVRDWSKEALERVNKNSGRDPRIEERMKSRVQNTKPTVPVEDCLGTYHTNVYGNITVSNEGGKMKIAFEHTPDLTATLEHWHYDTWKMEWQHPEVLAWFTFATVKFETDNNGKVEGISFDVPNDDFWFHEFNATKKQ